MPASTMGLITRAWDVRLEHTKRTQHKATATHVLWVPIRPHKAHRKRRAFALSALQGPTEDRAMQVQPANSNLLREAMHARTATNTQIRPSAARHKLLANACLASNNKAMHVSSALQKRSKTLPARTRVQHVIPPHKYPVPILPAAFACQGWLARIAINLFAR